MNGNDPKERMKEAGTDFDKMAEKSAFLRCGRYEEARHRICIRVMNYEHNRSRLERIPCVLWEDLAIVFFYEEEGGFVQMITVQDMTGWEIDIYELYRNALIQSRSIHPPYFVSMPDLLGIPLEARQQELPMYVLTCKKPACGSAVMFYPGILSELAERLHGDFYIIPSSIHELILVKKENADPLETLDIIRRVNREELLAGEILSDSLYEYVSSRDVLRRFRPCAPDHG